MAVFAASTDKIMETGLGNSSSSLASTQGASHHSHHHTPIAENRKLKIAAAVVFVLIVLVAGAALVGIYLSQPNPPPEVFVISIKDPEAHKAARLQVKFDKMEKVEYTMSPDVEKSGDNIFMMKDFSRGLVAHKDYRLRMCLVGRLNDSEDSARQRAKAFKNKLIQVAATENFLILNGSINQEVLAFAAGRRIAHYCKELAAYWLVALMPSDLQRENDDDEIRDAETETVKPSTVEETDGEEEKMQILTDTRTVADRQPQPELPPQDTKRLQEIEDQAVLEEKLGVQASEKLETPKESLRDHPPVNLDVAAPAGDQGGTSPSGQDNFPDDRPFLVPEGRSFNDRREEENKQPDPTPLQPEMANLFTEISDDPAAADERMEDVKSTADEKSTVEKAPHLVDTSHPSHLIHDELVLAEEEQSTTKTTTATAVDEKHSADSRRRRRREMPCTVRCWYFIRKLKGYRRCVYKCV